MSYRSKQVDRGLKAVHILAKFLEKKYGHLSVSIHEENYHDSLQVVTTLPSTDIIHHSVQFGKHFWNVAPALNFFCSICFRDILV